MRDIVRVKGGLAEKSRCLGQHHLGHVLEKGVQGAGWAEVQQGVEDLGEVALEEGALDHHWVKAKHQEHRHQRRRGKMQPAPLRQSKQGAHQLQSVPKDCS